MKITHTIKAVLAFSLLVTAGYGCSVRYTDSDGHDTLIGFPPVLNEVETAAGSNEKITWRRLRRTGVGLNFGARSFGFMIGYEHLFFLWVEGDGAWDMYYESETGMSINELKTSADPEEDSAEPNSDMTD
jgi:hypothetical protein